MAYQGKTYVKALLGEERKKKYYFKYLVFYISPYFRYLPSRYSAAKYLVCLVPNLVRAIFGVALVPHLGVAGVSQMPVPVPPRMGVHG